MEGPQIVTLALAWTALLVGVAGLLTIVVPILSKWLESDHRRGKH